MRATARLHPLETTLLALAGSLLCFMPWALGTMHVWSQVISVTLAAFSLGVALINRHYRGELAPQGDFKLIMWPKLLRFPLFWVGLAFLGYILVQALNPAWTYVREGTAWWLEPTQHISWLPSSVSAPFGDAPVKSLNAWRVLMIYSGAFMLTCALWVGVTRRSAVQTLLTVIAINGAVLAIIGILQKVTHAPYVLWGLESVNTAGSFFATLIYKNHAGAYLNLVLMLCAALLYWHFSRAERRMERTSPAPVFAFCAVLLGVGVLLTGSRAATILLMGFTLIAFIGFVVRCTVYRTEGRSPWVITTLCAVFALFIGLGAYFLKTGDAFDRIGKLVKDGTSDSSVASRLLAREATWAMAQDNIVTGHGAGSFRHYFRAYQRHYSEIYQIPWNPELRYRWEYAHNDYVQLLAELGLIGAALLAAMLAIGVRHLFKQQAYLRPHLLFIALALAITAAHAWVDFQFHNPAIIFLWCSAAALLGRWAELETRAGR